MKPSTTNGRRIKPFVAPTMRMMAISSRRSNMASLIVLEMMMSDTMSSTAAMQAETMDSTLRIVDMALATVGSE